MAAAASAFRRAAWPLPFAAAGAAAACATGATLEEELEKIRPQAAQLREKWVEDQGAASRVCLACRGLGVPESVASLAPVWFQRARRPLARASSGKVDKGVAPHGAAGFRCGCRSRMGRDAGARGSGAPSSAMARGGRHPRARESARSGGSVERGAAWSRLLVVCGRSPPGSRVVGDRVEKESGKVPLRSAARTSGRGWPQRVRRWRSTGPTGASRRAGAGFRGHERLRPISRAGGPGSRTPAPALKTGAGDTDPRPNLSSARPNPASVSGDPILGFRGRFPATLADPMKLPILS